MTLKDFDSLSDDDKACIQEVQTKESRKTDGNEGIVIESWVKIKLYDKQKSLDSISNLLGFNAPTKQEITGKDGKPIEIVSDPLQKLREYVALNREARECDRLPS
jgi:phage terminase small subunit